MEEDAAFLREQAERCRRLARSTTDDRTEATLLGMAKEYEQRANEISERAAAND
jgi:hypothetical protein